MEPSPPLQAQASAAEPAGTVAEDLPALYRAILERVAGLERAGARVEAARRMLVTLLLRADRTAAPAVRTRTWSLRRRATPVR
jgi:hypothetical protein